MKSDLIKRYTAVLVALILLGTGLPAYAGEEDAALSGRAEEYRIGCGDVLRISIWKNEDLTREVAVVPDGTITFPLIGVIHASDKTVSELKDEIAASIERYVPEPVLSVSVVAVNSMHVYVIGRVNHPGRFVLNSRVRVLQALAMAGGPNQFADKSDIRIFREEAGETVIFEFNYNKVSKGKRLEENIMLKRGDVIVVP